FFSSRRRHTRWPRDWSSDVCSSDLGADQAHEDDTLRALRAATEARVALGERFAVRAAVERLTGTDVEAVRALLAQAAAGDLLVEIGRASCRERVETSVVVGGAQRTD